MKIYEFKSRGRYRPRRLGPVVKEWGWARCVISVTGRHVFLSSVIWNKMSMNLSTRDSLLHGVSLNKKGKIIWIKSYEDLQMFVEEVLDLADGVRLGLAWRKC